MKIVYLLKQDPDKTLGEMMEKHRRSHEVIIVDIRNNKNYDRIVDLIAQCDKVISW